MTLENTPAARRSLTREILVLSLLSFATVLIMWAGTEGIARRLWPEEASDICMKSDRLLGAQPRANCIARMKAAEGPWVEDRWNECQARATGPCGKRAPGTLRIVTIGSSTSWGEFVPLQETWFARARGALRARCGQSVDFQSFGGAPNLYQNAARLPNILALSPDVVVMVITPFDIFKLPFGPFDRDFVHIRPPKQPAASSLSLASLREWVSGSRALLVAQHYMFINSDRYVSGYLTSADKADYLRPPFSAAWRGRLSFLDGGVTYIADVLKAAGIPLLLVLAPQLAQASLVSTPSLPSGINPYALGDALETLAARHGVFFVDASRSFVGILDPKEMFYIVNGHMNGEGHAVLASAILQGLMQIHRADGPTLCPDGTTVEPQ